MADNRFTLHQGNNIDVLKGYPDNHFDSIVTDPPYGIDFLGKAWDSNTGSIETYKECLRVLKPGGHLLAFSAARTYHHLAMSVELAGFEIRDQIMWVYSSGFPKSQDVGRSIQRSLGVKKTKPLSKLQQGRGRVAETMAKAYGLADPGFGDSQTVCTDPQAKQWLGWGTALKPAHEPIVVARKPARLSISKNVQVYGTGALNIDACRIGYESEEDKNSIDHKVPTAAWSGHTIQVDSYEAGKFVTAETNELGRFPSNVLGELGEYQKYFYCPKVSRKERHAGYDLTKVPVIEFNDPGKIKEHPLWDASIGTNVQRLKEKIQLHNESCITPKFGDVQGCYDENGERFAVGLDAAQLPGNNHPTVKPQQLMEYLIKLVTPPGSKVLDPFNGSGSTGMAAVKLGHHYTGIDLDERYIEISSKRITAWNEETNNFQALFDETTK